MQISGGVDAEFVWRCQLRQLLVKASAVMLGIVSAAIVMAEATLLFEADLSLFSAIVGMVGDSEMLVQVTCYCGSLYCPVSCQFCSSDRMDLVQSLNVLQRTSHLPCGGIIWNFFQQSCTSFEHFLNTSGMVGGIQVVAFIPLAYMCVCTYFSLIKLGMMTIYYLAPKQTSSVSLLMLCS